MKFNHLLEDYVLSKIDVDVLHHKIKEYFTEIFNEQKFRELEYLKIYPFISELQDEDIYKDKILKEKIKQIDNILNREENFIYDLWMNLEKCDINLIYEIWDEYKERGRIVYKDFKLLQDKLSHIKSNIRTVEDICLEKLLMLIYWITDVGG